MYANPGSFTVGTPMDVAVTWNTTTMDLYFNGTLAASQSFDESALSLGQILVGSSKFGSQDDAYRTIDIVRIWNDVHYTDNFDPNANIGDPLPVTPEPGTITLFGLVRCWSGGGGPGRQQPEDVRAVLVADRIGPGRSEPPEGVLSPTKKPEPCRSRQQASLAAARLCPR